MENKNPEKSFLQLFECDVAEEISGGLDGIFDGFRSELEDISGIKGPERKSQFTDYIKKSMCTLDRYCISIEHLRPEPQQAREVIQRLSDIVKLFPGYLLARRELINFLRGYDNQQMKERELEQEGMRFLDSFKEFDLYKLEGKYGGVNTKFLNPINSGIDYIAVLTNEVDNFSNLNNLVLFMNYFYDEPTYLALNKLSTVSGEETFSKIARTLVAECGEYKQRMEYDFEGRIKNETLSDEQRIDCIWQCRESYLTRVSDLTILVEELPKIVSKVDKDLKEILFRVGLRYEISDADTFKEVVLKCKDDLRAIKKNVERLDYGGADWEKIKGVIGGFDSLRGIQIASQEIKKEGKIEDETIRFLEDCVSEGLKPEDVGEASTFYSEHKDVFTARVSNVDRKRLVTFFTQVKRYDDEWCMVERFCKGRRVRHVVQAFNPNKFVYVLGSKAADLTNKPNQIEGEDIPTQMASMILEQNALKQFLGMYHYTELMHRLLKGTGKDSFFAKLCPAYMDENQLKEIQAFTSGFELERIPIHEYRKQATTRNTNFIADIVLGNAGVVRTFMKFYRKDSSESDRENSAREKFLLSGSGKGILENYDVKLPFAIEDAYAKDYQETEYNVLALGFINAHSLDEIVNDTSLSSSYSSSKKQIFTSGVIQLARIHNSTKNLEAKGGNEFKLVTVDGDNNYFRSNLKEQLEKHSNIQNRSSEIMEAIGPLADFLADLSKAQGVYYKDANPRNIMVQFHDHQLKDVMHIDYELGVKLLGEVDLFKVLRNGRGFEKFDATVDYKTNEWSDKREAAENYISGKRYLQRKEETKFLVGYNKERSQTYDAEAQKRFDLAAIHTHIWYVAWFSHKTREEEISNVARRIVGNRVNYHLMEAKLMLDHILHDNLHDNVPYIADERARDKLVKELNLGGLRETLDIIHLNENIR